MSVIIDPNLSIMIEIRNDINICYFHVKNTTINSPIVIRHNDSTTTTFKADDVVIIIHNDIKYITK